MLKAYWEHRTPREKNLLRIAMATFVVVVFYFVIWQPLHHKTDRLKEQIVQDQALLSWMQQTVPQLKGRDPSAAATVRSNQELFSLIQAKLNQSSLAQRLTLVRLSDKQVKVSFREVPFHELLKNMLDLKKQYRVQIDEMQANRMAAEGMVEGYLVLSN